MTAATDNSHPTRYLALDALRGWAILGVVAIHVALAIPTPSVLSPLFIQGERGVQLFFIVSAISLLLALSTKPETDRSNVAFFIRRFFRVAPMFYCALAVSLYLSGLAPRLYAPSGVEPYTVLFTALFAHGLHPHWANALVNGGWSIAAEMMFYLCVPVIVTKLRDFDKAAETAIVLSCACLVISVIGRLLAPFIWTDGDWTLAARYFEVMWFPAALPAFLCGVAIFHALREQQLERFGTPVALYASLAAMIIFAYIPYAFKNILYVPALGIFVLAVMRQQPVWLVNRISIGLGRISYSMYFIHFAVVDLLSRHTAPDDLGLTLLYPAVLLATVPLSYLTYMAIEKPGTHLGSKVVAWYSRRQAVAAFA
jgi:exopolysaccharide production protein ExoZ